MLIIGMFTNSKFISCLNDIQQGDLFNLIIEQCNEMKIKIQFKI